MRAQRTRRGGAGQRIKIARDRRRHRVGSKRGRAAASGR
jgi:hypothetical protein